ncbi:hypothetical protein BGZ65_004101, partial [Modicella reniformis]
MAYQSSDSKGQRQRRLHNSSSTTSTASHSQRHHHSNQLIDGIPTSSSSSSSRYDTVRSSNSISSTPSTSLYSHQSSNLPGQGCYGSNNNGPPFSKQHHRNSSASGYSSAHHSKHSKHNSKDDIQPLQQSSSNGNINDRPSIQEAINSIPPMLQQDHNTAESVTDSVLGEDVMLQEWLQKRSTSLQLVWKRRWCVLRDGRLIYYRSNTDTRPLGVLHLAAYSVLSYGPEISRKSKLAFRLSAPEPIPLQHQHHLFFTESAQSLQIWTDALQAHIDRAVATWTSMTAVSEKVRLQVMRTQLSGAQGLNGCSGGQSIIDKVLDRLQLEDSTGSDTSNNNHIHHSYHHQQHSRMPQATSSETTASTTQRYLPPLPSNFPLSNEDNNDTWSSSLSMPTNNASTYTTSSLDYIFTSNLQQQQQTNRSSMDSMRDSYSAQPSPIGIHAGISGSDISDVGYPPGTSFMEQQSNMSDASRSSAQSNYQGRSSLQQPRGTASSHRRTASSSISSIHQTIQSPEMYPLHSSVHSGASQNIESCSAVSPFASPVMTSQSQMLPGSDAGSTAPPSPSMFYNAVENDSSSKRPESVTSSTSISTIASSGDASISNDLTSDNGLSATATEDSQGKPSGSGTNHGVTLLGLVTGGKYRKDKERRAHSSANSSHIGSGSSGSPALKLFSSGTCSFSGCNQPAKTCNYHKKYRPPSPKRNNEKDNKGESRDKMFKKPRPSSADRDISQNSISVISASVISGSFPGNNSEGLHSSSYSGSGSFGKSLSKSMVSLLRDTEFEVNTNSVPLPFSDPLSFVTLPTRKRSPSVSVIDDTLVATQKQQTKDNQDSIQQPTGLHLTPLTTPSHGLPPPPPRASNYRSKSSKESLNLSRKMGLQIGGDFGALDQNALGGIALDGTFFVANHHRTMQKLQAVHVPKSQSSGIPPSVPGKSRPPQSQSIQQQQHADPQQLHQANFYNGVSRHIVAPHELALAIEQEVEELRRQQAQEKEAQKNRPTSMIKGSHNFLPTQTSLSTVSETSSSTGTNGDNPMTTSQVNSPKGSCPKDSQEGERIISSQEQLAYAPPEVVATMEAQRSPISSITSMHHPLSPISALPLPPSVCQSIEPSVAASGRDKRGAFGSSHSFPVTVSDVVSSTGSSGYTESSMNPQNQHQQPSTYAVSPLSSSLVADKQEFTVRSLPPPKRHEYEHASFHGTGLRGTDSRQSNRGGLAGRSSNAVAVTPSSPPAVDCNMCIGQDEAPSPMTSSLRPGYMTRQQPSSPVVIRLSEQGAKDISPLLNNGTIRTFSGDAPSSDIRRPDLSTTSSPYGSSFSTSTVSSSLCSFVASRHIGNEYHVTSAEESLTMIGLERDQHTSTSEVSSPTIHHGRKFRSVSSPLASVTPVGGSPTGSPSMVYVPQMEGPPASSNLESTAAPESNPWNASVTPIAAISTNTVSDTVVNLEDKGHREVNISCGTSHVKESIPPRRMLHTATTFVFPAPSTTRCKKRYDANGRPLSTCSTSSFFSEDGGRGEEDDESAPTGDRSGRSSRAESPVLSSSFHAAALELYPALRKLSLFTAAIGGHPPPALLSGRRK